MRGLSQALPLACHLNRTTQLRVTCHSPVSRKGMETHAGQLLAPGRRNKAASAPSQIIHGRNQRVDGAFSSSLLLVDTPCRNEKGHGRRDKAEIILAFIGVHYETKSPSGKKEKNIFRYIFHVSHSTARLCFLL